MITSCQMTPSYGNISRYIYVCMYKFTHMVEDSMDRTTATNWEHSVYESIKKNQ